MADTPLSIIRGKPLEEEEGLGTLTLAGWLREVTEKYGPREALVMHEGDTVTRWTYDDLWDRANEVARSLIACGVGKGTHVGVLMTNRPEFLSALWGAALSGATAVALSTFSTAHELEFMLTSSGCSVLLLERRVLKKDFSDMVAGLDPAIGDAAPGELMSPKFPFLRHVAALGGGDGMIEEWDEFLKRGADIPNELVDATSRAATPADPGIILYSSGSTALPKGIINSNRAAALQLWRWKRFFQTSDDIRTWSANGFFWSGNFGMAIGGTLSAGGSLILQSTFQPEEALMLMEKEKATMPIAWPHQWPQLEAASNWNDVDLSSLSYVNPNMPIGKHPTVSSTWQEPICAYGNTETFTISSIFESGTPDERIAGSSGEPQPGMIFKIVDPMTGETMPLGERGEIAVKGPTLMMGYIGIPLDESLDEQGFFRTGDGGYVDGENRLYWEGRLNDIIKTGGANVSPLEIDETIRDVPGVKLCQTVGVPHDTLGELVVTCVVPHDGETLSEDAIRAAAKEKLASYKVPRRVLFFAEDELEKTGTNKIKTADLRKLAAERLEAEDG